MGECLCDAGYEMVEGACVSIDDCASEPCLNGGSCTDGHLGYSCSCPAQWNGPTCGEDMDECSDVSLFNCVGNSTCNNTVGSYECVCDVGYEMTNGECVDIDECATQPCLNGAVCVDGVNGYTCVDCPTTHTGDHC